MIQYAPRNPYWDPPQAGFETLSSKFSGDRIRMSKIMTTPRIGGICLKNISDQLYQEDKQKIIDRLNGDLDITVNPYSPECSGENESRVTLNRPEKLTSKEYRPPLEVSFCSINCSAVELMAELDRLFLEADQGRIHNQEQRKQAERLKKSTEVSEASR